MYRIIRFGHGFDPAIIVSPHNASPNTPDVKYYRCKYWEYWQNHNFAPGIEEISKEVAMRYFSGQADGMGFEMPPEEIFPSLEAVIQYITKKIDEWGKKELEKRGIHSDEDWEQIKREFMNDLRLRDPNLY